MAATNYDEFEKTKFSCEFGDFDHEMKQTLRSITHTGMTFEEQDTTVQGDLNTTNTTLLKDMGRMTFTFVVDKDSKSIAKCAEDQRMGKRPGAKPDGSVMMYDSHGNETSRWNVCAYHIQDVVFGVGGFDAADTTPMQFSMTLDFERLERQ